MHNVELFTDGSCKGNGQADGGRGGWDAILVCGDHRKQLTGNEDKTTNNRMELLGVISGLEALKFPRVVTVYTDSRYVQSGITSWITTWKLNGWRTSDRKTCHKPGSSDAPGLAGVQTRQ